MTATALPQWTEETFSTDRNKLIPELRDHIYPNARFGPMLRHPLVVQVPFYSAQFANDMYQAKLPRVQEYEKKRQFAEALCIYERFCRLNKVFEWFRAGRLNTAKLRQCLRYAWPDTEDPPYADALEMFESAGYTSDTRKKLKGILTLYRGDSRKRHNMEWSLQRKTAEWFARRWYCKTPWVATTQIDADQALAYFTCRGEEEVIVNPRALTSVTYERIKP
jgi:hypothetical protein